MMVDTVVDVSSTNIAAQIANPLTLLEAGLRQLALRKKMVQHLKKHKISTTQDRLILSGHR